MLRASHTWPSPCFAAVLGLAIGCAPDPYACSTNADCDREGLAGQCLPDLACGYPVSTDRCPSGLIRSPNAAERPGECVQDQDSGGSDASGSGGSGSCEEGIALAVDTDRIASEGLAEGYPLLVALEDAAIASAVAQAGGRAAFTDDSGTSLPSELDTLDTDAGVLLAWVRLPALDAGAGLTLHLHYGDGVPEPAPAEVWAGHFAGVWHLGDPLSGSDGDLVSNSAAPDEAGRTGGSMGPEQSVAGVVGRGLQFDGSDDVVSVDAGFVGSLDAYGITLWGRYDGDGTQAGSYFSRLNGDAFYPRCWRLAEDGSDGILCQHAVGNPDVADTLLGPGQASGELLHIAVSRDPAARRTTMYVNGESYFTLEDSEGALVSGDLAMELGHGEFGSLPGMMDEVRVSAEVLDPAWVRADALTQSDPARTLLSITPCP